MSSAPEMTPKEMKEACKVPTPKDKRPVAEAFGAAIAIVLVAVFCAFVCGITVGTFVWAFRLIAG